LNIIDRIDFLLSEKEITRNNWIIGSFFEETEKKMYELHICNDDVYTAGLLIDDTWSQYLYDKPINEKEDIYVLVDCQKTDDFILPEEYCYFLDIKRVIKKFVLYDELAKGIQDKLKPYCGLKSEFSLDKGKCVLSLVTTVFNNAFLLEQTIQSVINQRSCLFEYIIKDACSTDNFKEVIKKYKNFGIITVEKKDNGIYDGMNQGFEVASGDYIQILNSDDVFYNSEVISTYIAEIKKEKADAYCSDILLCFPNGNRMIRKPDLKKLRYRSCINHTSLVLKKLDYFRLGGFDKKLKIAADGELTIKMVKAGLTISRIPIICVNFRMGGASSSISWNQLKEGLICRYRYSFMNFDGYLYTLLHFIKQRFF